MLLAMVWIMIQLRGKLTVPYASWSLMGYHQIVHSNKPCSWSWGLIPAGVVNISP